MTDPSRAAAEVLVRRYFDAVNTRRLDELDACFPPDFVSHLRVGDVQGLVAFKALLEMVYAAFPDVLWTPIEEIYTADRAVIRYFFEGTHVGPFLGIPPSHRFVRVDGCEVMVLRDGRVPEIWNYADMMSLAAQVNAVNPLALRV